MLSAFAPGTQRPMPCFSLVPIHHAKATWRPSNPSSRMEYMPIAEAQATLSAFAKLPPMILRISSSEKVPSSSEA
jgi:hypothetical protein